MPTTSLMLLSLIFNVQIEVMKSKCTSEYRRAAKLWDARSLKFGQESCANSHQVTDAHHDSHVLADNLLSQLSEREDLANENGKHNAA